MKIFVRLEKNCLSVHVQGVPKKNDKILRFIFFHSKDVWEFSNLVFREVYLMRVWVMGNTFFQDRCILYSSRFRKTCVFQWALFPIFSLFFHTKTILRLPVLKPRKCLHFFSGLLYDECEHTLLLFIKCNKININSKQHTTSRV